MNDQKTRLGLLAGRLIVGSFYLYAGLDNLINLPGKAGYAAYKGVPLPMMAVAVAGLLLLVGGFCILTGYRPVVGIAALVIFFVPVTIMMHNFWTVSDPQARVEELRGFLSNLGLAGSALIFLAIPRPWPWSLEELWSGDLRQRALRLEQSLD